jgi:hypothetical protein
MLSSVEIIIRRLMYLCNTMSTAECAVAATWHRGPRLAGTTMRSRGFSFLASVLERGVDHASSGLTASWPKYARSNRCGRSGSVVAASITTLPCAIA